MIYSYIAFASVCIAIIFDFFIVRTKLILKAVFWTSYAIIFPFQLITNYWLTHRNIVMYDRSAILGLRLAGAPIEDLFFGFSLILSVLSMWVWVGRNENDQMPTPKNS